MISPDVFSIIPLSDCVQGQSLLVISPDVISINLLSDCVPGRSLCSISPDVLSINLSVLIHFIGIYRYVKLYS